MDDNPTPGILFETYRQQLQSQYGAQFYEMLSLIKPRCIAYELEKYSQLGDYLTRDLSGFLVTYGTCTMMNLMGSNTGALQPESFIDNPNYSTKVSEIEQAVNKITGKLNVCFAEGAEFVFPVGNTNELNALRCVGLVDTENQITLAFTGGIPVTECKSSELSNAKEFVYKETPTIFNTVRVSRADLNLSSQNVETQIFVNQEALNAFVCSLGQEYFGQDIATSQIIESPVILTAGSFNNWSTPFGTSAQPNNATRLSAIVQTNAHLDLDKLKDRSIRLLSY